MGRILAIDYGSKRVGLAVTDPLRIIASSLEAVHSKDVIDFLKAYLNKEKVDIIVVGEPKTLMNVKSDSARFIDPFVVHLQRTFPDVKVERYDERFTSSIAQQTMLLGGMKKKDRKVKSNVDKISATIILQDYMEFIKYKSE
ncbi:MAG: Holliday junction resolvase RuvX [Bacteroidia bacterium]|nr:Holliday junction resolvase RuvX [Sphingobacteriaceae bacterium]MBP9069545.1 Holliday junction resolvase RuvX [Bacteroidia bacterium]